MAAKSKALEQTVRLEKLGVARFLQGREIKAYSIQHPRKVLIIPYDREADGARLISAKEYAAKFPLIWDYLKRNRKALAAREDGRMDSGEWYAYIYPKNLDVMRQPKLVVPDTAAQAAFAYDEDGEFAFASRYAVTFQKAVNESPLYFLALLNSSVLDFYWKRISTQLQGGFFRYFSQFIAQLPVRRVDFSNRGEREQHDLLVSLVRDIIRAKRGGNTTTVTSLISKVDETIFRLYDVTASEKAVLQKLQHAPHSQAAAALES